MYFKLFALLFSIGIYTSVFAQNDLGFIASDYQNIYYQVVKHPSIPKHIIIRKYSKDSVLISNGEYYSKILKIAVQNIEKDLNNNIYILDGVFSEYHPDGKLKSTAQYTNGRKTGDYSEYYTSGKIKKRYISEPGKKKGIFEGFYENGQMFVHYPMKKDQVFNQETFYYPNGALKLINYVSNGKSKKTIYYYPNGIVKRIETQKNEVLKSAQCFGIDGKDTAYFTRIDTARMLNPVKEFENFLSELQKCKNNDKLIHINILFRVNEDSSISNVSVKNLSNSALQTSIKKLVKEYLQWKPSIIEGVPQKTWINLYLCYNSKFNPIQLRPVNYYRTTSFNEKGWLPHCYYYIGGKTGTINFLKNPVKIIY